MAVGAYFAGVGLALCTTAMSALGMALQKLTHKRLAAAREKARMAEQSRTARTQAATVIPAPHTGQAEDEAQRLQSRTEAREARKQARALRSWRQPMWIAGIGLMLTSSLLSLAVFALVGQAVASSFAAITLVWNALFGRFLLREHLTRLDVLVTLILMTGSLITVAFGAQRGPDARQAFLDEATIQRYFSTNAVVIFSAIYGFVAVVVLVAIAWLDRKKRLGLPIQPRVWFSTAFGRAFLAGTFSATTGLCSKGFTSLISATGKEGNGGQNFGTAFWLFLCFLPFSVVLQITYLNRCVSLSNVSPTPCLPPRPLQCVTLL